MILSQAYIDYCPVSADPTPLHVDPVVTFARPCDQIARYMLLKYIDDSAKIVAIFNV